MTTFHRFRYIIALLSIFASPSLPVFASENSGGISSILVSMEDNAELLDVRRTELANTWQRIHIDLIKNFRNKPIVMQGDRLVGEIEKERKPAQTIKLSSQLLDFVDKLEIIK